MKKHYVRYAEYLSLFAMVLFTSIAIVNKNISVFYILYLFWCDEFLKTIFDYLRYRFKNNASVYAPQYLSNTKSRLFMLMVYLVFIIVFFGLILDWKNQDLILSNFEVFLFKNQLFNFSLITFLLREVYLFWNGTQPTASRHLLSRGIITLHVSLLLGMLFWFLITKKIMMFQNYATIISIIPFLILKIFFEVQEINAKTLVPSSEN
jgi:hypothetical protein